MIRLQADEVSVLVIVPARANRPEWMIQLRSVEHLTVADADAPFEAILRHEKPDVIVIAESCAPCLAQIAGILAARAPDNHRPAFVLVTDSGVDTDEYDMLVDVIAPSETRQLDRFIRKARQIRDERVDANRQVQTAQMRIEGIEQQLETQRKTARELELLKNMIVNNVSHELKTPLLHVKAAVALLAEDALNPKLAEYATGATARLEALVRNITQLAGSQEMNMTPILFRECITYALTNLGRTWEHKDAVNRVHVHMDDRLPPILGDRQGISTVLQLLIDNALKFSEAIVEVSAHRTGSAVLIAVRDHGIGIPKDQLEIIFDSFYQVDGSSTRPYGGAGIGLAIVRLILEKHSVQIKVESEIGIGSVFSFSLPVAELSGGAG